MPPPDPRPRDLDLPPDLVWEQRLSASARWTVDRVRRGARSFVLRVGKAHAGGLGLAAPLAAPRSGDHGLVRPVECGSTPRGRPYSLRPWIEGVTLDRALRDAPASAAELVRALLEALGELHAAGQVHRDIKPDNVLVDGKGRVRVIDLDSSSRSDAPASSGVTGTRLFIAPEVLLGAPHRPQADLFSVGVLVATAYAAPRPGAARDFPARTFWEATGIEADALPRHLLPLVRALVRRRPADRPASAAAAAALLVDPGVVRPPERSLGFWAGRDGLLAHIVDGVRARDGVLVVEVDDPREVQLAAEEIQLALIASGRAVFQGQVPQGAQGIRLARAPEAESELVRVLTQALLFDSGHSGPQVLVGAAEVAAPVLDRLEDSFSPDTRARLVRMALGPVSVEFLLEHLMRLVEGAAPRTVERLAHDLHQRCAGRAIELDQHLERALDLGVLRAVGGTYAVLRETWPADGAAAAGAPSESAEPSEAARLMAAAIEALGPWAQLDLIPDASGLAPELAQAAWLELLGRGCIESRPGEAPRLTPGGKASLASLAAAQAARLAGRCSEVLEVAGAPAEQVARLRAAGASSPQELQAVLEIADAERRAGRLGAARALLQAVLGRARALPAFPAQLEERAALLEARLELGQDHAHAALDALRRVGGAQLEELSPELLAVAAEALELCGEREQARAAWYGILARQESDRATRLRARTGLGHAALLDGDPRRAIEQLEGYPVADDPDEPAAVLDCLRAGALAQLGRIEEGLAALDRAAPRAARCGDPTLVGRVELNRGFVLRRASGAGRALQALAALERARRVFDRTDHVKLRALAANNAGVLLRDRGELDAARRLLQEALLLRRRAGDAHGSASTLASLGIAALESGHLGEALERLDAALELLVRGGHAAEERYVRLHASIAHACAGSLARAEALAAGEVAQHPVLELRARAALALAHGRPGVAIDALREAAGGTGEATEALRAALWWAALAPGAAAPLERAEALASQLEAPALLEECSFARARRATLGAHELEDFLARFERMGRTDLVRAVAERLARAWHAVGNYAARRRVAARGAQARERMAEGLEAAAGKAALALFATLTGAEQPREPRPAIGIDWFLTWNRRLARADDLEDLLLAVVDAAIETTRAQRGMLVLLTDGAVDVEVARGMESARRGDRKHLSQTIVRRAIETREAVVSLDAGRDPRFASAQSVRELALRSVLCVPLPRADDLSGALYVDHDELDGAFDEFDVDALQALTDQAAVAIHELRRRAYMLAPKARVEQRAESRGSDRGEARPSPGRGLGTSPAVGLVGESAAMLELRRALDALAASELTVLLEGPGGVVQEDAARALHARSANAGRPYRVVSLAGLPREAQLVELFGETRGEGRRDSIGALAGAASGTLFLDGVEGIDGEVAAQLAATLASRRFVPLGGRRAQTLALRLVCGTSVSLSRRIAEGAFDAGLYALIREAVLRVPTLAERAEDVPSVARAVVSRVGQREGRPKRIAEPVLQALAARPWPGDVRELSSEVTRLYFLSGETIDDLGLVRGAEELAEAQACPMPASYRLDDVERAAIVRALEACGHKKLPAARLLGISRAGLYTKMKRLGLVDANAPRQAD